MSATIPDGPDSDKRDTAPEEILNLIDAVEPQDEEARSSTSTYLNEIGMIGLLDAPMEWALAERVQAGDPEARQERPSK